MSRFTPKQDFAAIHSFIAYAANLGIDPEDNKHLIGRTAPNKHSAWGRPSHGNKAWDGWASDIEQRCGAAEHALASVVKMARMFCNNSNNH